MINPKQSHQGCVRVIYKVMSSRNSILLKIADARLPILVEAQE